MATFETHTRGQVTVNVGDELRTSYTAVPVKRFPKRVMSETSEEKFWRSFRKTTDVPAAFKGRVTCVDFCPAQPHTAAVTGQGKVMLFNPVTHERTKELNPSDTVYCTKWRGDGKMLATSGEKTTIRLWTLGGMKMIRELPGDPSGDKGHRRAVHSLNFLSDRRRLVSGGDDSVVFVWDVATQQPERRIAAHTDYVRATAVHPHNPALLATGSHDKTIKLWDLRTPCTTPTHTYTVADPVACLAYHPSSTYVAAASSSEVSLWDCASLASSTTSSTPLSVMAGHTKDITALCFNYVGSRILTGSADRHVKVYETENFTAVHTMSFPEPVFAVGLSQDGNCLTVGGLEGKVYLRTREVHREKEEFVGDVAGESLFQEKTAVAGGAFVDDAAAADEDGDENAELRYYSGMGDMRVVRKRNWHVPRQTEAAASDFVVESARESKLSRFDVAFRKFNYRQALDEVLAEKVSNRDRNALFLTVVSELHRRNGLRIALSGRDAVSILQILTYVSKGTACPTTPGLASFPSKIT